MEPAEPLPAEQIIEELTDPDHPLFSTELAGLSNLNAAEQQLFEDAWNEIEPERRREIVLRLVELTEENVELNFDSLFKFCLKDPDDEVRAEAIEGLWENEETSLIEPLITLLEQDRSEQVQVAAAMAMGKYALLAEHKKLRAANIEKVQQSLLAAFDDERRPVEVRRRALESIAPLGIPQVKTAINKAYRSLNPRLRISSVYAMGRNCDPSWTPLLLKEMNSSDAEMRYEAAGASGELEEEDSVPGLINLVSDPDADVRMAAIQALGKIASREAIEYLKKCLESESEVIRQTAEEALNELESGEDPLSFFKI